MALPDRVCVEREEGPEDSEEVGEPLHTIPPTPPPPPPPPPDQLGVRVGVSEKVRVRGGVALHSPVEEGARGVGVGRVGENVPPPTPPPSGEPVGGVALGETCGFVAVGAS